MSATPRKSIAISHQWWCVCNPAKPSGQQRYRVGAGTYSVCTCGKPILAAKYRKVVRQQSSKVRLS